MALKKTLTIGSLFAIFASGGFASLADAQQARMNTPSATFEHRAIELPGNTGPLVTPGVFNYDAQAFAPVEFTNDEQLEPNCGFFFTVDKTYTSVSRPDRDRSSFSNIPVGNDWVWGERYQLGYMTEADQGWEASYWRTEGTFFARDELDPDLDGDDFVNTFTVAPYSLTNQLHLGELNRVFRQALKNGDTFEPYLGGRYTGIIDDTLETTSVGVINITDADGDGIIDVPDALLDTVAARSRQRVNNSAVGFQLGGRHRRRRGRMMFTTDGALGASYNHQRYVVTDFFLQQPATNTFTIVENYFEESSFIPSLDLEMAVSYNITRDITMRLGANFSYLWSGVGRANTLPAFLNPNSFISQSAFTQNGADLSLIQTASVPDIGPGGFGDDSYIASGFTFGVEWKR